MINPKNKHRPSEFSRKYGMDSARNVFHWSFKGVFGVSDIDAEFFGSSFDLGCSTSSDEKVSPFFADGESIDSRNGT
jgi:hypothetical protein